MTEILPPVALSLFEDNLRDGPYFSLPDRIEPWKDSYLGGSLPMLSSHWSGTVNQSPIPSLPDMDLRLIQQDNDSFIAPYTPASHMLSPSMSYQGSWTSDVAFQQPSLNHPGSVSAHSPNSPHGSAFSPVPPHAPLTDREPIFTAVETRSRRATTGTTDKPTGTKRSHTSMEGDDGLSPEYKQGTSGRGRRRQRIPHTQVERRYRENLNAHLDKLRLAVPTFNKQRTDSFATSTTKTSSSDLMATEGGTVKPSKCEILNGAIEHITAMDVENDALKSKVKLLQARIDELERWYQHGGGAVV